MFFILVHVTFLDACLNWSLASITEQQVCPHRLPIQYWLKNHWPDQALFKHSLHTNCISNSAILRNNYISLLSDLCTCVHMKKKWRSKGSHSSSVSSLNHLVRLQTCKNVMGWCTAQWRMLLFVQKPSWKSNANLNWRRRRRRRRMKNILAVWWISSSVLSWCFLAPLGVLFVAYKLVFFEIFFVLAYIMHPLSLYIESLPTLWYFRYTVIHSTNHFHCNSYWTL